MSSPDPEAPAHLFLEGFGSYLESGDFADLELRTERRSYQVHRILLIYSSDYFSSLLTSDFKEKNSAVIELKLEDPEDLFPKVLQFIYEGHIEISESNAMPLLALSDHYLINPLRDKVSEFICHHTTQANVLTTLQDTLHYHVPEVTERCVTIIAKNFCRFSKQVDWNFLPPEIFQRVLQEDFLTIGDENNLYLLVRRYIDQHRDEMSTQQMEQLMGCLRFRWMSYDQLVQIQHDPLIPFSLFTEAIMARLLHYENPSQLRKEEMANPRLRCRPSFGTQFEYNGENEHRGIVHWIATNRYKSPYTNPHTNGEVLVTVSSLFKGHEGCVFGSPPGDLCTQDVPASWICIDFGENRAILPTHYTLRHGENFRSDFLRTWDFQGSKDGREWTLLRRHTNDQSLREPSQVCTWSIETEHAFQKFRVLQTGHSSNNRNFLVLSGIELHGDYFEFRRPSFVCK